MILYDSSAGRGIDERGEFLLDLVSKLILGDVLIIDSGLLPLLFLLFLLYINS